MEYMSVIRDELGEIVRYCRNYTERENKEYLVRQITVLKH